MRCGRSLGSGPADLDATADAFDLLDRIVDARIGRGSPRWSTPSDWSRARRQSYLDRARAAGLPAVLVIVDTRAAPLPRAERRPGPPGAGSRARRAIEEGGRADRGGRGRGLGPDRPDHRRVRPVAGPTPARADESPAADIAAPAPLSVILQVSRFDWGEQPGPWLRDLAAAAADVGFDGLAVMDHLIQIPQVGRAWDPIPGAVRDAWASSPGRAPDSGSAPWCRRSRSGRPASSPRRSPPSTR